MDQDDLRISFRRNELQNRRMRLTQIENQLNLQREPLTEEERLIDAKSRDALQLAQKQFEKSIYGGYWRRLWAALLDR